MWNRRSYVVVMMFLAVVIGYSDRVNISVASMEMKDEFGWSQTTKGVVLSAFFIGYMAFMFVSGWLATRYSGRLVFGLAVLWWSSFTLLTPLAASISLPMLIAARIALGIGESAMFPAAIEMMGRWVPSSELTRANATVMCGISFGTVVGLIGTSFLVGHFHWPVAFYAFGAVGLVWTAIWFKTVVNDPHDDPRMHSEERAFILASAQPTAAPLAPTNPASRGATWRAVMRHREFWALVVTHFAATWTLYMLVTWLPSYLRDARHLSIQNSGLLSAAPWLAMFVSTFLASHVADRLTRRTGRLGLTRKVMQSVGLLGSGALLLVAQRVDSVAMAVTILCIATLLYGCVYSGYGPNFLDIAPRHASILAGFSNTIATIPGIVGVSITGWLVDVTQSYAAAFVLAASISLLGSLTFCAFGTGRRLVE